MNESTIERVVCKQSSPEYDICIHLYLYGDKVAVELANNG